jgi:hypothetical protein
MHPLISSLKKAFIPALLVSVFSYGHSEAHDFDVDQDAGVIIGNGHVTTFKNGKVAKTAKTKLKEDEMTAKTEGVFYCTAFCMRGKTEKGTLVRGLYHWDSLTPAQDVFKLLKKTMIKNHGVQKRSISTVLVGTQQSAADWQEELMDYQKLANIQAYYTAKKADGEKVGINVYMNPTKTTFSYVGTK